MICESRTDQKVKKLPSHNVVRNNSVARILNDI